MFNTLRRASSPSTELNVVPVMNLFMVLIPFLLLGAAFYQIAVIPTSTATHDPHASDVPSTPTTVAASLVIEPDLWKLSFASTSLTEEELAQMMVERPLVNGMYDLETLQATLLSVKEKYPESTTMTVLPHDKLSYQKLVELLDASREVPDGQDDKGSPKFKELFPVTVFSRLIRSPEEAENGQVEGEGAWDVELNGSAL